MELFPNETSPNEFDSRPIRAIALCIPTVHHVTQKMHVHIREQNYICNLTLESKSKQLDNVLSPTLKGTFLFGSSISVHGD